MIKICVKQFLVVVSIIGITACGGGGGSSGGSGGGKTSVASVVSTSSSVINSSQSSSAQSSVVNLSPTARIQFPRKDALSLVGYSNIEVSGVAYDDKGIKSVKVNGVAAALNTYPAVAQSTDIPATHSYSATWNATIKLLPGDTPINIEVTDSDGLVLKNAAAPLAIRNAYIPMGSLIDNINDRMIGSILNGSNIATNLQTLTSVALPFSNYGVGESLNNDATQIYLAKVIDGFLKVYSSKIATGVDSLIANYDLQMDVEKHAWIDILSGTLSLDSKFYFATVRYVFLPSIDGTQNTTKLLKIDTSNGFVSILAAPEANPEYKNVSQLFYDNHYLFGFNMDEYENSELIRIDSQTGERTNFLSIPKLDLFALNSDRTILYGITYDKFVAINIADKVVVSKPFATQGSEFEFTQFSYFLVDEKRNRLIASNAGTSDIIAIDITSGERSVLIKNGIGEGASLVWPDQLEVTSDDKFAYVFDGRLMATDTLFKIDLATGNRTVISDFSAYNNNGTAGLALDEPNNRIFFAVGLTIGIVDLATGLQEVIASPDIGLGVTMETLGGIDEIIYDRDDNRLLVSSSTTGLVMAIDMVTFKRTVAFDSFIGDGPELKGISGMALNAEAKNLYISSSSDDGMGSILSIDMKTGDRTLVLDKCVDKNGFSHPIYSMRTALEWDNTRKQLFIINHNEILVQDIANNKCSIINTPADDVAILSDSTLIGLSVGLSQIHPFTGSRAILSK